MLAAEEVWLGRLRANAVEYRVFLQTLTDHRLTEGVTYRNSQGVVFQTAVGDILHHVSAHRVSHRGQIALLLRQAGLEPVNTDFITFVREGQGT